MQRIMPCPTCNNAFGSKDVGQQVSRLPLLLHCGHTVCEACLTKLSRSHHAALPCPIPKCQEMTPLTTDGSIKCLQPDLYMLGLITATKRGGERNLANLMSFTMVRQNSDSSGSSRKAAIKTELCGECGEVAASCRCTKCDVAFCEPCFQMVHSGSRILRHHVAVPLSGAAGNQAAEIPQSIPSVCVDHNNRPIEYFCETDSTPICSHCVIMGPHRDHAISQMEDKNKSAMSSMQVSLLDAKDMNKHLQQSLRVTQSILPEIKQEMEQTMGEIRKHFSELHATLQNRERKLLEKVENIYQSEAEPVEQIRKDLAQMSLTLDATIKEANQLLNSGATTNNNAQVVLSKLKIANNKQCLAKVFPPQTPSAKAAFPEELKTAIVEYGDIIALPKTRVELCSLDNAPQEVLLATIQAPATPTDSSVDLDFSISSSMSATDSETASVTSSASSSHPNAKHKAKHKQRKAQTSQIAREEVVFVTHIKHPGHFVAQRVSDSEKWRVISKQINRYCNSPDVDKPHSVDIDMLVLAKYARDSNWYRARVMNIDVTSVPANITVYYVDYGNTEVVTLDRLRLAPPKFTKLPELAIVCGLFGVAPMGAKPDWSAASIQQFAKLSEDKALIMNVMKQEELFLWVDLSLQGTRDDIQDEKPLSLRNILAFLDLAIFTAQGLGQHQRSSHGTVRKREFLRSEQPSIKAVVPVMVSHVSSPSSFAVQKITEEAHYLSDMMADMKEVYSKDKKDALAVYCPEKDMICAAQFSGDDQWYRAQVLSLPGKQKVTVRYVDFGNTETIPHTRLKKLLDKFLVLAAQAFECSLADIKAIDDEVGWEQEASAMIENAGQGVVMRVVDVVDGSGDNRRQHSRCLQVLLYDDQQKCVNQQLIDMGLAVSTGLGAHEISLTLDSKDVPFVKPMNVQEPPPGTKLPKKPEEKLQKVFVSHVETPGDIYIQTINTGKSNLDQLMQDMAMLYTDSPVMAMAWTEKSHCAVCYSEDNRWYRGIITRVDMTENAEAKFKVLLLDYGYSDVVSADQLRPLEEHLHEMVASAIHCHLADVQPAGDIHRWSRTACEYLRQLLLHKHCYVVPKGNDDCVASLAVDLLLESFTAGDALSADRVDYLSVTQIMRDEGLALPKRRSKSSTTESTASRDPATPSPVTRPENAAPEEPKEESEEEIIAPKIEDKVSQIDTDEPLSKTPTPEPTTESPAPSEEVKKVEEQEPIEVVVDEQALDDEFEAAAEEEEKKNAPKPTPDVSEPTVYLPHPIFPMNSRDGQEVVATYVDYDGNIYVQEVKEEQMALLRENTLEAVLQDTYLEKQGLVRARIPRDGNCLYRCYAQGIFSDQSLYMNVRRQLGDKLDREWDRFKAYVTNDTTKQGYLIELNQEGCYGGELEIVALSELYTVKTHVFDGGLTAPTVTREYSSDNSDRAQPGIIQLAYTSNGDYDFGHYDLVLQENNPNVVEINAIYEEWRRQHIRNTTAAAGENLLQQLMAHIQLAYTDSASDSASHCSARYEPGEACVAPYSLDSLYYRAQVLEVTDHTQEPRRMKVKFVDFGNNEELGEDQLRPPMLMNIPIQCCVCQIHDVIPADPSGKWRVPDLDALHQLVVGKVAKIVIMEACKPGEVMKVQYRVELDTGVIDVRQYIKHCGAAVSLPGSRDSTPPSSPTPDALPAFPTTPPVIKSHGSFGLLQLSPQECLSVCVTQVDSPSHVYVQYNQQDDPSRAHINTQLQSLVQMSAILNSPDTELAPVVKEEVKPGLACVAPFSVDCCWYRAEVSTVEGEFAGMLFVDYGSAEWVHLSNLRCLPSDLPALCAQARRCTLVGMDFCQFDDSATETTATEELTALLASTPSLLAVVKDTEEQMAEEGHEPLVILFNEMQYKEMGEDVTPIYTPLMSKYIGEACSDGDQEAEQREESPGAEERLESVEKARHQSSPSVIVSASFEADADADVVVEEEVELIGDDDEEEEERDHLTWADQVNASRSSSSSSIVDNSSSFASKEE